MTRADSRVSRITRSVKNRSPAAVFLRRAQLTFMLAALLPTVLLTVIGILLLATGGSRSVALIAGILVVVFCATALTGYIIGTFFVTRGATLAAVQNEFLAAVSHEIRTPLTSMRMFLDTLRENRVSDPAERQRCLTIIHEELIRLDGLVGRLIELSRIEAGRGAFVQQPVRVEDLVGEALAAFEAVHVGKTLDLRVSTEAGLFVKGDRSALARAVANLLTNAWKYTPEEGKRIEVTTTGDEKQVHIVVTDNGVGIPRDEQRLVFDKFERGSSAIDGHTPGSGLGLAIVRAIVREHKGTVKLHSEPARGSTFRISLPRLIPS